MNWKPTQVFFPDLSHYEWPSDLNALADSGCVGVIYKATQSNGYQDPTYSNARTACYAGGMLWGMYHFGENTDVQAQANNFLAYAMPTGDDLICLDLEDYGTSTMSLDQAKEWITLIETNLGREGECVVYGGNWLKERLPSADPWWAARRLWLCQYTSGTPELPAPWKKYWAWQYTDGSAGPEPHTCAGVDDSCDMNAYDGTESQLAAEWSGGQANPPPPPPSDLVVDVTITAPPGVQVNIQQITAPS